MSTWSIISLCASAVSLIACSVALVYLVKANRAIKLGIRVLDAHQHALEMMAQAPIPIQPQSCQAQSEWMKSQKPLQPNNI